jgi:hypothetical protein
LYLYLKFEEGILKILYKKWEGLLIHLSILKLWIAFFFKFLHNVVGCQKTCCHILDYCYLRTPKEIALTFLRSPKLNLFVPLREKFETIPGTVLCYRNCYKSTYYLRSLNNSRSKKTVRRVTKFVILLLISRKRKCHITENS